MGIRGQKSKKCARSLTDKVAVFGTVDEGSIPPGRTT